jgi:hypothetical protein
MGEVVLDSMTKTAIVHVTNTEVHSCYHCYSGKINKYVILVLCMCSLRYPACNVHPLYWHVWSNWLYIIFSHYLIKSAIFLGGRRFLTQNVYFDFLYNFCLQYVLLKEELSEIWSKMYIGHHVKYPLFLCDFKEIWIFLADFQTTYKFHENPSSGRQDFQCGRTDRHAEANSCLLQFCKCA